MNRVGTFRKKQKRGETTLSINLQESLKLKAIWNICRENDYFVIRSMLNSYTTDAVPLWDAIRDLLDADGVLMYFVREYLKKDIDETRDQALLFRSNSGITHLMNSIMRKECHDILHQYVEDIIITVNALTEELEVDPNKIAEAVAKANSEKLLDLVKNKIMRLELLEQLLTPRMKYIFTYLRDQVEKKFPDHAMIAIGGFFFLRFLNPALLSPQRYDEKIVKPNEIGHKTILYLTKIFQVIANKPLVPFNEEYMRAFSTYCLSEYDSVTVFLMSISDYEGEPPIHRKIDDAIISEQVPQIMRAILGFKPDVMKTFKDELCKVRGLEERFMTMIKSNTTYEEFIYVEEVEAIPQMETSLKNQITYYENKINVLSERILDLYHLMSCYIPGCSTLGDFTSMAQKTKKLNAAGQPVEKVYLKYQMEDIKPVEEVKEEVEDGSEQAVVQDEDNSPPISTSSTLSENEDGITMPKRKYKDISDDGEWSRSDSEDFVEAYKDTYKKIVDIKDRQTQGQPSKVMSLSIADYEVMAQTKYKIPEALNEEIKKTIHSFHRLLHKCHRCDDPKRLYHVSVELIIVIQKFTGRKQITTVHQNAEADINMIPTTRDLIDRLCRMFVERLKTDTSLTIETFKRVQNWVNDDIIKYIKEEYEDIIAHQEEED